MSNSYVLNITTLPLSGTHIIEASAGTGKTYNITKLYLRLLLERELSVKQILVMTFTNAATDEIKARVAESIRDAIKQWDEPKDETLVAIKSIVDDTRGKQLLQAALLASDEAAIFTINSFCNRLYMQYALNLGVDLQTELVKDTQEQCIEAIQDWLRGLKKDQDAYLGLAQNNWHDPVTFYRTFHHFINNSITPTLVTELELGKDHEQSIAHQNKVLADSAKPVLQTLISHTDEIVGALANEQSHFEHWLLLLDWLAYPDVNNIPEEIGKFVHGNRFRKHQSLSELFEPVRELRKSAIKWIKDQTTRLESKIAMVPVLTTASAGLSVISKRLAHKKLTLNLASFQDAILTLSEYCQQQDNSLVDAIRKQYPVAMIDEFQDTDAHQYAIFKSIYTNTSNKHLLVLIGDPKQAIYSFRGGDVFAYLDAKKDADHHWFMNTNWRSSKSMVEAYNQLFVGIPSGDRAQQSVFDYHIDYQAVNASPLSSAVAEPLHDNNKNRSALTFVVTNKSVTEANVTKRDLQNELSEWIGSEIIRLLNEVNIGERSVQPQDIAILVKDKNQANVIKQALQQANLASVYLSERQLLMDSQEAMEVERVLVGILHHDDDRLFIAAHTSSLLGLSSQDIIDFQSEQGAEIWEQAKLKCIEYLAMWQRQGVMALLSRLIQDNYRPNINAERSITNMMHVAEVMGAISLQYNQANQQLRWLQQYRQQLTQDDEMQLRLESDQALIKIVTQHSAKGLEYPIVFVPFATEYREAGKIGASEQLVYQYHHPETNILISQLGRTVESAQYLIREQQAEDTRLLYVAVTRAVHRCYLGLAGFKNAHASAIGRICQLSDSTTIDNAIQLDLSTVINIENEDKVSNTYIPAISNVQARLAKTSRSYDNDWALMSFSQLVRHNSSAKQNQRDVEINSTDKAIANKQVIIDGLTSATSAYQYSFEKGAKAGNFLHDILENIAFDAPDWSLLDSAITAFGIRTDNDKRALQAWLESVLAAPLFCDKPFSLSLLTQQQILKEAEFYFPVNAIQKSGLFSMLVEHRQRIAARLNTNVHAMDLPNSQQLNGMMHGFIDLIFECDGQYFVADYKSNYMGDTADAYQASNLYDNMQSHYYDLQYLIYSLALHRHLKNSIDDYDASKHFGGVLYLYIRAMNRDNTDRQGIYFQLLLPSELERLDALFDNKSGDDSKVGAPS